MRIATRILLIGLIPVASELVFFFILIILFQQLEEQGRTVEKYRSTASTVVSVRNQIFDQFRSLHQYALDRESDTRRKVLSEGAGLEDRFSRLQVLLRDQPVQLRRLARLKELTSKWTAFVRYALEHFPAGGNIRTSVSFMAGSMVEFSVDEFRQIIQEILDAAESDSRDGELKLRQARLRIEQWFAVGMAANLALSIGLLVAFSLGFSRRSAQLAENIDRYSQGDVLAEPISGTDELALIDSRFRHMVDCLETMLARERAILSNIEEVLCSLSADGTIVQINEAALQMFGVGAKESIGENLSKIIGECSALTDLLSCMDSVACTENSATVDLSLVGAGGRSVDVLASVSWSLEEECFFVVFHDVTLRRQFERFLREQEKRSSDLIEAVAVGIASLDDSGRIAFVNSPARNLLGDKSKELLGRDLITVLDEQFEVRDSLEMEGITGMFTEYHRREEPFQAIVVARSVVSGSDRQWEIATLLDITDRVKIERLRADFIAMLSHDLRAPMASISLFLEMINEGKYDASMEKLKARSRLTYLTAFQLIDMLQNILDMEKWDQGMFVIARDELDSENLCRRAIQSLEPLATAGGIMIESELASFPIVADELRVLRVLNNLIANAIGHTKCGGSIRVGCFAKSYSGYFFVDNPAIIPPEEQAEIFKKFKQSGRGRSGGAGLGLTICQQFLQAMGGEIGVRSSGESGTRFWFTLPLDGS